MAQSSSEQGSERFVQWNECMTEDIDITNLIGPGSIIFGKRKKSKGAPGHADKAHRQRSAPMVDDTRFVKSSQPVPAAARKTPPPPQLRQKSSDLSSVAVGEAEDACRRRSSNIVVGDAGIVMSCLSPTAVLTTPPPPKFKPPRRTPNSQSSSGAPRATPPDETTRAPHDTDGEQGETEEQENGDTSTPHPRGDHQGKFCDVRCVWISIASTLEVYCVLIICLHHSYVMCNWRKHQTCMQRNRKLNVFID